MEALRERGLANGLAVRRIEGEEAHEHEPHVAAIAALHVPETGVVDYTARVRRPRRAGSRPAGADLRTGTEVLSAREHADAVTVETTAGPAAGRPRRQLRRPVRRRRGAADRPPAVGADRPVPRRVPRARPGAAHLVRGLVYPVPDPELPFLGVHLTRGVDGHVHAGPNAVLALSREGYRWADVRAAGRGRHPRLAGVLAAGPAAGAQRGRRGGPLAVCAALRRQPATPRPRAARRGPRPAPAGVRAQAVARDGRLVDDFLLERHGRSMHLLNAPSPAATASLEIARARRRPARALTAPFPVVRVRPGVGAVRRTRG